MFNDPFDCMLNICLDGSEYDWDSRFFEKTGLNHIPEWLKSEMKKVSENSENNCSLESRNRIFADHRILSLSSNKKEILLWSHYADEHKGVCLEYKTLELYDDKQSMHGIYFDPAQVNYQNQTHTPNNLLFASKVDYESKLPKKHNLLNDDSIELRIFIYTKYLGWNYENEWRIFLHKEDIHTNSCVKLAPNILKGIIFGMKATRKDIMNVQTFLSQNQNVTDVEINKAVPQPNSYAINIKKYDSFSQLLEDD
jgi:hypothetical protein